MSKLSTLDYVFAAFFLISLITAIGTDIMVVERYGWVYNQTTIIGSDVSTETINMRMEIWTYTTLGILIITLLLDGRSINNFLGASIDETGITGIDFPKGKPDNWFIEGPHENATFKVKLGEWEIIIPYSKIKDLFKEDEDKTT